MRKLAIQETKAATHIPLTMSSTLMLAAATRIFCWRGLRGSSSISRLRRFGRWSSFWDFLNSTFTSVRLISCTQNEQSVHRFQNIYLKHISNCHFQPKNSLTFNYFSAPTTKSREKVEGKNWEGRRRLPAPKKTFPTELQHWFGSYFTKTLIFYKSVLVLAYLENRITQHQQPIPISWQNQGCIWMLFACSYCKIGLNLLDSSLNT